MANFRRIVEDYFKSSMPNSQGIQADTNLIEAGIFDSIVLFDFIVYLEDTFKFHVDPFEISEENFRGLSEIMVFIEKKLKETES
jgi:acyl carrier protein